jgi:hypothetical protein
MSFTIIDIFPLGASWRIEDVGACESEQSNACDAIGTVQSLSAERARGGMPYSWQKGPAWDQAPRMFGECETAQSQRSEGAGMVVRREIVGTAEVEDFIGTVSGAGFVSGGDEEAMAVLEILNNI